MRARSAPKRAPHGRRCHGRVGFFRSGVVVGETGPGGTRARRTGPSGPGRPTDRTIDANPTAEPTKRQTRAECVLDTQHGPRARDRGAAALLYCQNTRGSSQGGGETSKRILQRLVRCIFHNNAIVIDAVRTRRIRAKRQNSQPNSVVSFGNRSKGYPSYPWDTYRFRTTQREPVRKLFR